jgi:uridine kinase
MDLISALFDICASNPRAVITIDGPAGGGKTTLASHISNGLNSRVSTSVIHMDDLYNGWKDPFGKPFIDALVKITSSHIAGIACDIPQYDWATSSYGASKNYQPANVLILEGVGSSASQIRDRVCASIWIEINPEDGLQRVLQRDGVAIATEMAEWLRTQHAFFTAEQSAESADFALTT